MAKRIKKSRTSLTKHADKRKQQRAISDLQVQLIEMFGEELYQKGGTGKLYVRRKVIDELRHAVDKLENVTLIKGEANKIITVMHQTRKINSTQYSS